MTVIFCKVSVPFHLICEVSASKILLTIYLNSLSLEKNINFINKNYYL